MNLSEIIALAAIAALVAFEGYRYERIHLPQFAMIQAEVLFEKCLRECKEICEANGIDADECICEHCRKYIEVE